MSSVIHSFSVAYRLTRGRKLRMRECCHCGCGRTFRPDDRVCATTPTASGERRFYFSEACMFTDVNRENRSLEG